MSMNPFPFGSAASIISSTFSSGNFFPRTIMYYLNSGMEILPEPERSRRPNYSIKASIVSGSQSLSSMMSVSASFVKKPSLLGSALRTRSLISSSSTGSTSRAQSSVTSSFIGTTSVPSQIKISHKLLMSCLTSAFKTAFGSSSSTMSSKFQFSYKSGLCINYTSF